MMRLKEIRKELGITQKQLAQELSISIPQISRYENGQTAMTPETIIKICNYLGVTADQLLGHHPISFYPIYRDTSWVYEGDMAPDVLNSVLSHMKEHLVFLEDELSSIRTLITDSQCQLNILTEAEQRLQVEKETVSSYYTSLRHLFLKLESCLTKSPQSIPTSENTSAKTSSYPISPEK